MIGFHVVVCCGLPLLAAIIGVASPFSGLIPHALMDVLLVVAGLSLIVSWAHQLRGCGCHKTLLTISTLLFVVALAVHLVGPHFAGAVSCH